MATLTKTCTVRSCIGFVRQVITDGTTIINAAWEKIERDNIEKMILDIYDKIGRNSLITGEEITGADGSTTAFNTVQTFILGTTEVFKNGVRMLEGSGDDYVETDTDTITFSTAPETGDQIQINYQHQLVEPRYSWGSNELYIDQSGGTSDTYGALGGTIDGSNKVFTVSQAKYISGNLKVFLNGQLQTQGSSEDWVETNPDAGTFTFATAPVSGDEITVMYLKSASTTGNADTVDSIHAGDSPTSGKLITDYAGWQKTGDTFVYASSDDPTYTITISGDKTSKYSAGMRIKLTDSGTQYFIITKVAYGAPNTTLTLYGGTDYDLSEGTITNPYYSCMKAPHGFPLDPDKWTVEVLDTTIRQQESPTQNQWYNLGTVSIDIPIGVWSVSYSVLVEGRDTSVAWAQAEVTLSTANNSESDANWTTATYLFTGTDEDKTILTGCSREKVLNLATKDTYYLNTRTTIDGLTEIDNANGLESMYLKAVCAYL